MKELFSVTGPDVNFGNSMFSSHLEFQMMGNVHKPSNSKCYTPSLKPLRCQKYSAELISHPKMLCIILRKCFMISLELCVCDAATDIRLCLICNVVI
jgi:hypothetical protein